MTLGRYSLTSRPPIVIRSPGASSFGQSEGLGAPSNDNGKGELVPF